MNDECKKDVNILNIDSRVAQSLINWIVGIGSDGLSIGQIMEANNLVSLLTKLKPANV